MSLSMKLKQLRKEKKITQEDLAKQIGVERSSIGKYETGTMPSMEILALLADFFNVSIDYLIGKTEQTNTPNISNDFLRFDNIFPIETKKFPLLGEIACGKPIFTNEDRESYVMASTKIKADFCLKAKGDSMINARIMDGDIIFIREQSIVDNGEIAAVIIDNEATLKRVYYYPEQGKLMLTPENPKYTPLMYVGDELNSIRILGKAIAFQSDII